MSTITQRKKLSKSAWLLVILLFAAVIGLIDASTLGYISLQFLADGFIAVYVWASLDIINALLLTAGWFMFGVATYYIIIKYFVCNKVTAALPGTYTPQGQTLSNAQQQGTETVIS